MKTYEVRENDLTIKFNQNNEHLIHICLQLYNRTLFDKIRHNVIQFIL